MGVTKCVTRKIFAAEMAQALQRDAVERAFTLIVAVQPDPAAPFVSAADYNIIADRAEFAGALLRELARGWRGLKRTYPRATHLCAECVARLLPRQNASCQCLRGCARIVPREAP